MEVFEPSPVPGFGGRQSLFEYIDIRQTANAKLDVDHPSFRGRSHHQATAGIGHRAVADIELELCRSFTPY